jgi:thymidylate kinase
MLLFNDLCRKGCSAEYIHYFTRKTLADKARLRYALNTFIEKISKCTYNRPSAFVKIIVRLTIILIDSWLTYCIHYAKFKRKIIIYDRYCYDSLVAFASCHKSFESLIIIFSKLIPKPNVVILLQTTPQTAVMRKPEHTIAYAERLIKLYDKLKLLIRINTINAESNEQQIKQQVKEIVVLELLKS